MNPKVSVIIVNWKSEHYVYELIGSLKKQVYRPLEVIIVNNSPEVEIVIDATGSKGMEYISLEPGKNLGYAGGNNAGIARATGEYILLLNPDTIVEEDTINNLVKALEDHQKFDVALPKIMQFGADELIDRVWDGYSRWGLALTIGYREYDEGQYSQMQEVFGARGAACLFRRNFFAEVGNFDEDLFAFYEDVDLSIRGQLLKKRFLYVPHAQVYHHGSATTGSVYNATTVRYSARNKILVYLKDMPGHLPLKYAWRLLALLFASYVYHALITKNGQAFLQGVREALAMKKQFLKKRQRIHAKRTLSIRAFQRKLKECEHQAKISRQTRRRQAKII